MSKPLDRERCYFCPRRNRLEKHHIVPQRKGGSDTRENLVVVCERCHKKLERLYDKRFYDRLGVGDERGKRRTHFVCRRPKCDTQASVQLRVGGVNTNWFCFDHAVEMIASGRGGATYTYHKPRIIDTVGVTEDEIEDAVTEVTTSELRSVGGD